MNPYELLKNDHEKVSDLFKRIESASGEAKLAGFKKLKAELDVHTLIEETIFYPALKNADETRDITLEAYEEHKVVKDLLAELAAAKPNDQWDAKFTVLKENVEHHVDEEESDLFKKAKDVLSTEQAEALGDQMATEKERQGAPVPEELEKPGLIKRVVNSLFGGTTPERAAKKKKAEKAASKKTTAKPNSKKSSSKKPSVKKSGGKKASSKKTGTKKKPTAKKSSKKGSKKSAKSTPPTATAGVKKAARKSPAKARARAKAA
jgi:hemerythrin-like domain-containing protein